MCKWLNSLFGTTTEKPSPSDILPTQGIQVAGNTILLNLGCLNIPLTKPPKVWIPEIPDTNSMDGAFDIGHNNLLIAGATEEDQKVIVNFIKVGDVVVYLHPHFYAIHRIVEIGNDADGRYFIFKGDNNPTHDPYRVRDEHIQWLSIGTIY